MSLTAPHPAHRVSVKETVPGKCQPTVQVASCCQYTDFTSPTSLLDQSVSGEGPANIQTVPSLKPAESLPSSAALRSSSGEPGSAQAVSAAVNCQNSASDLQSPEYVNSGETGEELPILFLQCRPAGLIADDERQSIAQLGGLEVGTSLISVMMLEEPQFDPLQLDLQRDYAAVIISGSPFGARATAAAKDPQLQWMHQRLSRLVEQLLLSDLPCLGLCYGLQLLGQAAGVSLTDQYKEDLQAVRVSLTAAAKTDPVTARLPSQLWGYVGHVDALADTPSSATLLGQGDFCPRQLLRFGKNVYGTQFHPEITTEGMRIRINTYGDTYYAADQKQVVEERCLTKDVTSGNALVAAFIQHYREVRR